MYHLGRLAIKHHPDKNRDDPNAEERFKAIAIAYQTLSDPALRRKYNEFGSKDSAPEGGFVDPEEVFSAIFGGERFVPIIGEISLGREMKTALQEADDLETPVQRDAKGREILSPEEKARRDEKQRQVSAKVRFSRRIHVLISQRRRKLPCVRSVSNSSLRISSASWGSSPNPLLDQKIKMLPTVSVQFAS